MPSTTNYKTGELVLVDFPFTASGQSKPRPALVVIDTGDADVLLARVTTQPRGSVYNVPLRGWQHAGLLAPFLVRLHKLATLAKTRIQRKLGTVDAGDRQQIKMMLQQLADSW